MSLSIVTAVCGIATTLQWIQETVSTTAEPRQVCVAFNGCTPEEIAEVSEALSLTVEEFAYTVDPEPQGSAQALNAAVGLATGDVLAILHNDLMIRQPGWDRALLDFFEAHPEAGLVGFAGAKKLGRDDIFKAPYELTQLVRSGVWTSLEDWVSHGSEATEPVSVAVLDGLAICCRRETWDRLGGFDEDLAPHHCIDQDLSLRALGLGLMNYVVPIRSRHLSGQTSTYDRYQKWAEPKGGDAGIHAEAHRRMYEKWRGKLPIAVP